jgi:ATP-binding cassette subfamily B protein
MLLVVVSNVFTILGPLIVKLAIDGLTADLTQDRIVHYALLLVGAALVAGAARYGMRELLNGISRKIETDLRNDLFSHLLRLPPQFYDRWRTGDLMSRATNDVQAVRQVAGPSIMYLVNTVTIGALALGLMIWISPRLTAVAMIPMVMMPGLVIWIGRKINVRFERIQEQFSEISNFAQENLAGIRIVKAYGREADRSEAFAGLNAEYRRRNMDLARIWGAFFPTLTFMGGLGSVLVLWFGGREVIAGAITVGDYVAFGFYLVLLMWPMIAVGWVTNQIQRGAASMGRINSLLAEPHLIEDPEDPISPAALRGGIEFRDVSFRYPGVVWHRTRADSGRRGGHGERQEHARAADPAPVRRRGGKRGSGWRGRPADEAGGAAKLGGHGASGSVPVQHAASPQPHHGRLRERGARPAGSGAGHRPAQGYPGDSPGRPGYGSRRAGHQPVGRAEAAGHDRAGPVPGDTDPDPGRLTVRRGYGDRGSDSRWSQGVHV